MLRIRLLLTLSICLVPPCALNGADGAGDLPAKTSVTLSQATHVVIGTVRNLYAKKISGGADQALYTRSLLEIDVLEVEKRPDCRSGTSSMWRPRGWSARGGWPCSSLAPPYPC
jgi:hypothetical protein